MSAPVKYRGSITREQVLLNETRIVARLMLSDGLDDADIVSRITEQNLFQYPTEREQRSIARACIRRLRAINQAEQDAAALESLCCKGTLDQLAQTNLYAMACDNRLVWDLLACIIAPKLQTFDYSLTRTELTTYLEGLRAQDERIAGWSTATVGKIRQVLAKALESAGMYNRKTAELHPPLLDPNLENLIRTQDNEQLLAAFGVN